MGELKLRKMEIVLGGGGGGGRSRICKGTNALNYCIIAVLMIVGRKFG